MNRIKLKILRRNGKRCDARSEEAPGAQTQGDQSQAAGLGLVASRPMRVAEVHDYYHLLN